MLNLCESGFRLKKDSLMRKILACTQWCGDSSGSFYGKSCWTLHPPEWAMCKIASAFKYWFTTEGRSHQASFPFRYHLHVNQRGAGLKTV